MRFKNIVLSQSRNESPFMILKNTSESLTRNDEKGYIYFAQTKYPKDNTVKTHCTYEKGTQQVLNCN